MLPGHEFSVIKSSLRSLTFSDRLEIHGREGDTSWTIRVDGLSRPERTYEVDCGESFPSGEWLIKNTDHAVVISLHGDEPRTSPVPLRGFSTRWVGGDRLRWLVIPLARRLARTVGVNVPVNQPVWAAIRRRMIWNWWEPAYALSKGHSDNRILDIPLPEKPVWNRSGRVNWRYGDYIVSIWQVPSDTIDGRIPVWEKGWIGTLHHASEKVTDPYPVTIQPARIVAGFVQGWPYGVARLKSPSELLFRPKFEEPEEEPVVLPQINEGEEYLVTIF